MKLHNDCLYAKKIVLKVLLGSCFETEKMFSQVKLAFSDKVAFIQPNTAGKISFLFRFSQRITGRFLLLEITFTDFILALPSSWYFI